ncbi:major facilitator superfamily domain-containing protein [Aspergillus cavernicola]|uniref:Major facilitator superfamily domain-containing protein n=1 Tax=Aspergillus cavernicola TaxID=176166 RepID=A0ABR4IQP1_9EURO
MDPDTDTVHEKQPVTTADAALDPPIEQNGIRVHPQPTSDPLDPLNWSRLQKHTILAIVMFKYFLFTYLTTTTVPSFPEIQTQFAITYSQVNWTVAIPALGLSVGPLFWSSLSDTYGRRIVFVVGTFIALVSTIGAAVADTYGGYMAARFFQGFGVSPASSVGLAVVNDLFFDYERGEKLGLWVLALDSGLLLGPTFGGFLNLVSTAWINWFNAILFAALLLLELLFMPETLYPRSLMLTRMPKTTSTPPDIETPQPTPSQPNHPEEKLKEEEEEEEKEEEIPRTKTLPFLNTSPIPSLPHPPLYTTLTRFLYTFTLPVIPLCVLGYSFLWYWWVLSVITMIPAAYPQYSPLIQGLLFLGLLLGTVVSEITCSGKLSDRIVGRLAKRNGGVRVAEMRVWLAFPAVLLTAVGLILFGVSIDKSYHWMVGQVALFLFAAGIQIGNTVTSSYIIDSYPLQSTSVVIFYAVFLNLSAFVNPFFITPWQESVGWTWTFTTQALIALGAGTLLFAGLQRYGGGLRARAGLPGWVNPEFDSI